MSAHEIELVAADGALRADEWFTGEAELDSYPMQVLAVMGAGAASLANALAPHLVTNRDPPPRFNDAPLRGSGALLRAAKLEPYLVALLVQGDPAAKRALAACANFAGVLANVAVVNVDVSEVGRADAPALAFVRAVLAGVVHAATNETDPKLRLVLAVRDVEPEERTNAAAADGLRRVLEDDVKAQWISCAPANSSLHTQMSAFVDLDVCLLPHSKFEKFAFDQAISQLAGSTLDALNDDAYSFGIPADSFSVFTRSMWDEDYASAIAEASGNTGNSTSAAPPSGAAAFEFSPDSADVYAKTQGAFRAAMAQLNAVADRVQAAATRGECIADFHAVVTGAYKQAVDTFKAATSTEGGASATAPSGAEQKLAELQFCGQRKLAVLYGKHLQAARERALADYKSALNAEDASTDYAFFNSDRKFCSLAAGAASEQFGWGYEMERSELQNTMRELAAQRKRMVQQRLMHAQNQSNTMRYLQTQQAQLQAIQQSAYSGGDGQLSLGAAYRPPDTNLNISLGYQQGRTSVQISVVPDEYASYLGPQGFSAVGPANLGLSFNMSV
ncbi:Protein SEY1-like 2 [Porphyridium purpureum]|uniref:Protein SEY1-like 2 n=1 Tax=Porphyridium purpureum TaxID=35688 RepID=A0A5J4YV92_PORPP|nr:Protein SEY1-like 2 [Porphyridium purpureum]|eukprot:POR8247..scf229_5